MAFIGINGAVVANTVGKKPVAYLIRKDVGQIAALDLDTPAPVDFCAVRMHTFTGENEERNSKKKIFRVKVFGEGMVPNTPSAGYMIVTVDSARSYVYPWSILSPIPSEGLLWSQNTHTIVGQTIDVTLYLTGTGIVIREMQCQYVIVN